MKILTIQQIANFAVNRHPGSISTQAKRDVLRETLKGMIEECTKASCKEQRKICAEILGKSEKWEIHPNTDEILNAPEPSINNKNYGIRRIIK